MSDIPNIDPFNCIEHRVSLNVRALEEAATDIREMLVDPAMSPKVCAELGNLYRVWTSLGQDVGTMFKMIGRQPPPMTGNDTVVDIRHHLIAARAGSRGGQSTPELGGAA